jgi:hypothetical protein
MVITILEARVEAAKWSALEEDYKQRIAHLPPQMARTFLLQDVRDPALWQILSVWKSREALDEMRNSGEIPEGVVMFHNVGSEPKLSIFNVPASAP